MVRCRAYVCLTCPQQMNNRDSHNKHQDSNCRELLYLMCPCFRHFRNKIKSGEQAFLILPVPWALCGINKPSGCVSRLANDSKKALGLVNQECPLTRLYSYREYEHVEYKFLQPIFCILLKALLHKDYTLLTRINDESHFLLLHMLSLKIALLAL